MSSPAPHLNYYAIVNGINSLVSLAVFLLLFFKKARKPIQLTYALFSLLLFAWASCYFMWGIQTELSAALFWLQALEYPVAFIHVAYFHFMCIFVGHERRHRNEIVLGYLSSIALAYANSQGALFDLTLIRDRSPFKYWPNAAPTLGFLIAFEVFFVLRSLRLLWVAGRTADRQFRGRINSMLMIGLIGWSGGITNWFYYYDFPAVPPVGNPAVTFYLLGTAYLIVRHDILDLNLIIKRTFVYGALTLLISTLFLLAIFLSEWLFRSALGYNSLFIALLFALALTVIYTPVKSWLERALNKVFFGKSIEELSDENTRLLTEVQRSSQARSVATLAAGMAHEIKNPLTAIKTFTEHLPSKAQDPAFLEKFRAIVGQEVDKIDSIVRQVLEFSRPQAQMADGVDINALVDSTLDLLNAQMVRNHITLEKRLDPALPAIRADRKLLQQALLNVLLNAIEAMSMGGRLQVETTRSDRGVWISITDSGCGITASALPRIFDPFYSDKESGTGLGLSIVKGIIDQHGGKVGVRSAMGQGTEFIITLPDRADDQWTRANSRPV